MNTRTFAKTLRRTSTDAERELWRYLRDRRLAGHKFKRQHPIGNYIVDFVCLERRLIVELDGGHHATQTSDAARDRCLGVQGYIVVRVWNNEIYGNLPGVLAHIHAQLSLRQGIHGPSP